MKYCKICQESTENYFNFNSYSPRFTKSGKKVPLNQVKALLDRVKNQSIFQGCKAIIFEIREVEIESISISDFLQNEKVREYQAQLDFINEERKKLEKREKEILKQLKQ